MYSVRDLTYWPQLSMLHVLLYLVYWIFRERKCSTISYGPFIDITSAIASSRSFPSIDFRSVLKLTAMRISVSLGQWLISATTLYRVEASRDAR